MYGSEVCLANSSLFDHDEISSFHDNYRDAAVIIIYIIASILGICAIIILNFYGKYQHRGASICFASESLSKRLFIFLFTFKPFLSGLVLVVPCHGKSIIIIAIILELIIHIVTYAKIKCSKGDDSQSQMSYWKECIRLWYPELESKTYFLPPVHFNKEHYEEETVASAPVYVQKMNPEQKGDEQGDTAEEKVLRDLRNLADENKEVMMVISQLKFGEYLHKQSYAAAGAFFPQAKDIPAADDYRIGEFDILIIHRTCGIITGEIKSVGADFQPKIGKRKKRLLCQRVKELTWQLEKSEKMLNHLLSDVKGVKVIKTLMLPNVTKEQFTTAIDGEETKETKEKLRECFNSETPTDMCLFKDTVRDEWWKKIKGHCDAGPSNMTEQQYEDIVASYTFAYTGLAFSHFILWLDTYWRFCGPASTVSIFCVTNPRLEIRTEGQAIAETGSRMARFTLLPEQLDLVNENEERLVFLNGPPGTGKTVVLILKSLKWLENGYNVHLVSTWYKSRPATYLIEHALNRTTTRYNVHRHMFELDEGKVDEAITEITSAVEKENKDKFCVIVDEPGPDLREDALRMFPKKYDTYDYKVPMIKEKALEVLQNEFNMSPELVKDMFPSNNSEHWELNVQELQQFYTNYTIANRWRESDAHDFYYQEYKGSLPETTALKMLEEKCGLEEDDAKATFKEICDDKNNELRLREFQRFYASHDKSKSWRENYAKELFTKNDKKDQKKALEEQFSLIVEEEKCAYTKLKQFQDFYNKYAMVQRSQRNNFSLFCEGLSDKVSNLYLWAGAIERHVRPFCLKEKKLTAPLRSPPVVVDEVQRAIQIEQKRVHSYNRKGVPYPTLGPDIIKLTHSTRGRNDHHGEHPKDCKTCGEEIAKRLKELHVDEKVHGYATEQSLTFRDVLVLCEDPQEERVIDGQLIEASGLVQGLRCETYSYPVRVVCRRAKEEDIIDTAVARHNKITVSHYRHAHGLERKMVILAGNMSWNNDYNRLYDMSRTTAQLVEIVADEL